CKRVVLKNWLGRRATKPVEHEFIRARENVGAVVTDTERNVTHQRDAALLRMRFNVSPLLVSNPLHVTKEVSASCEDCLLVVRKTLYPVASTFRALMLRRPSVPCSAAVIFLDENTKERVIVQPWRLFFTEFFEVRSSLFFGASG